MTRRINEEGLQLIKQWEGFVGFAYDDLDKKHYKTPIIKGDVIKGVLTIGYGSTGSHVRPGMSMDYKTATELLMSDLTRFEARVEKLVTVPLTDNQFAALVSFDFNTGALHRSTLLKELNKGNYERIPFELAKWNKAKIGGKHVVMAGLSNRRAVEAGLWAKGAFVAGNTAEVAAPFKPIITKESVTMGAGMLATVTAGGNALFEGVGPIQWALAAIIVTSFAIGAFLFLKKRTNQG